MISFIPSKKNNAFYNNTSLNRLVDISLDYLNDNIFKDILFLIKYKDFEKIKTFFKIFKLDPHYKDEEIYNEIKELFRIIYKDKNRDNLRGIFLELLIYKGLKKKYNTKSYIIVKLN